MKTLPATAMRSNGADYLRTYHHVVVPVEVTLDDLMRGNFWAHHTNALHVGDLVDVLNADMTIDAQFRVVNKGIGFVQLRPLRVWQDKDASAKAVDDDLPELPQGYMVNHAPKTGWRVFTKDPDIEVQRGLKTKRAAYEAAIAHAKLASGQAA